MNHVWLLLAILAASVEPVVAKLGYTHGVALPALFVGRGLVAALAVWPITGRGAWARPDGPLSVRDRLYVGLGGVLLATTSALTLFALTRVPTSIVVVAATTTPALVAAVNHLRGHERVGSVFWLGVAACVTGVVMSLELPGTSSLDAAGAVAALAAVGSSCLYRLHLDRLMKRVPPAAVSTWVVTVQGVAALLAFGPLLGSFSAAAAVASLWTGVFAALANVAFLRAMQIMGATRVSVFVLLQRPVVIALAGLLLDEPLGVTQWAGCALVVGGIWLTRKPSTAPTSLFKPLPTR